MSPRRGFALSFLAACGIHAVILLVPRAAAGAEPPVPTIELDLATAIAAPQGGQAMTQAAARAPARGAAETHVALKPPPAAAQAPVEAAPVDTLNPTEPPTAVVSAPEPAGVAGSRGPDAGSARVSNGATNAVSATPAVGAATAGGGPGTPPAGTGAGGGGSAVPASVVPASAAVLILPRPRAEILPTYPGSARRAGFEGLVKVAATVDATGAVTTTEVLVSSGHASLDTAALEAVRRALFAPALQGGKPVSSRIVIPIRFRLQSP
ncbi:MAG: energy transducer TonB [Spirochaetia bacterium]